MDEIAVLRCHKNLDTANIIPQLERIGTAYFDKGCPRTLQIGKEFPGEIHQPEMNVSEVTGSVGGRELWSLIDNGRMLKLADISSSIVVGCSRRTYTQSHHELSTCELSENDVSTVEVRNLASASQCCFTSVLSQRYRMKLFSWPLRVRPKLLSKLNMSQK